MELFECPSGHDNAVKPVLSKSSLARDDLGFLFLTSGLLVFAILAPAVVQTFLNLVLVDATVTDFFVDTVVLITALSIAFLVITVLTFTALIIAVDIDTAILLALFFLALILPKHQVLAVLFLAPPFLLRPVVVNFFLLLLAVSMKFCT